MAFAKYRNKIESARIIAPVSSRLYTYVMLSLYGAAILACFICNLAVSRELSWFYVVLAAVALAFCITNLPLLLKRYKLVLSALAATGMVYVLLFACCAFVKGDWLLPFAYPLATYALLFAWAILLIVRYARLNPWLKAAAALALLAAPTVTLDPLINYLLDGAAGDLWRYVVYDGGDIGDWIGNAISGAALLVAAAICARRGIAKAARLRAK